jgi:hypothetical protein
MFANRKHIVGTVSGSWEHRAERHGAHAVHGAQALQQRFVECVHLPGIVIFSCGQTVTHREQTVSRTTNIGCAQPKETLQQQSGGDQQYDCDCDLYREQRLAQRCAGQASAVCA